MNIPFLITDNEKIGKAYRLAVATLAANIFPFKDGILEEQEPVIIAGLGYSTPWTRDAAINTWNAGGLICPEESLNTLKSVLKACEKGYMIGGEYWDSAIFSIGAWSLYLFTGDKSFLKTAYEATVNTLEFFEETEFDAEKNLFRGPACYGDGIAAYPDIYAKHGPGGIISFAEFDRDKCCDKGVGIPMFTLSTNCLYYYAYVLADKMATELSKSCNYAEKAEKMREAINKAFWSDEKGNYTYICDNFGGSDKDEGMGASFALLFGIADDEQKNKVLKNQHITERGIPCVWPTFERYTSPDGMSFGRHSGTVWPHIQGFWADAAARSGEVKVFENEFINQTENALRYMQFAEIYHPVTGEMYGGRQEDNGKMIEWNAEPCQTWSATAYLRNVYYDIFGMRFGVSGISFAPVGTSLVNSAVLKNLRYRSAVINITLTGNGRDIKEFKINGESGIPFLPSNFVGKADIEIIMQ